MKHLLLTLLFILLIFSPLNAESMDDELFGSEEDLFGSSTEDDLFGTSSNDSFIVQVQETEKSLDTLLLTQDEGVRIGGSFSFKANPGFKWYPSTEDIDATFSGSLDSKLFIDARMSKDTRFYSSFGVTYPVTNNATSKANFSLKELFADITYQDTLFFRVGKQTINWGVGYFFSPADLLNLSDIDPLNASNDLEGPVAVKMTSSLGIDNLYAYIVLPPTLKDARDLAYALKYEKVFNKTEVGLGAYYRYDNPPAAMLTFSSSVKKVSLFGEAVLQYGSNKTFITGSTTVADYKDTFFFLGTIGGSYTYSAKESDFSLSLLGQYFFNGEGYSNTDIYDHIEGLLNTGKISVPDLFNPGMHYAASNISFTFTKNIGASLLVIGNMTDFSGVIQPSISYSGIKNLKISLSSSIAYGKEGTEYTTKIDPPTSMLTQWEVTPKPW
ncbi:MAG: hypothetical protein EOM67_02835, partial [Spirochaetia bacterium]|nr:hypothetical protein [Spirochaetia bacterium]